MYTVYMVDDLDLIDDYVEELKYIHPIENSLETSNKLIWDSGYEGENNFWNSLREFNTWWNKVEFYCVIEWLPGIYETKYGVQFTLERVRERGIEMIWVKKLYGCDMIPSSTI